MIIFDSKSEASLVTLTGPNGSYAQVAPVGTAGPENDYYFFDITGGSSGQVFTFSIYPNANPGPNTNPSIGGLTFDSGILTPEPSGLVAMVVAILFLVLLLERRRILKTTQI